MTELDKTIRYYNENAKAFVRGTAEVEFEDMQRHFTDQLQNNALILDFGCGSGRDTKYFLEHGYKVTAIDGSEELCRLASEYTGIEVKQMLFQELNDVNFYDGIWACSSILHLKKTELEQVLNKMKQALKNNGIIYTSFKYGTFEGERNGRHFTDMTEEAFENMLKGVDGLAVEEKWITTDVRPGRGEERWLNLILRKI
ncbi:tellurite resistance protein TehB [uncultured Roseburia sp.]|uniref:Class I SAM-dependent methyltransferase n=1 Tax=Brotonthovivens ammoniilytica TaxID=2981725 RepID=A0ABT2TLT5_9FIRM|nr:class I SAM-dependent methyltransferase [Brotonthovivens ammoniilytica]MCU6763170.1 class I SAM-dependent methyltransferase [Brotonthovivens ammoniilytica]SCJ05581.1 tellurite resistance protein TehB [uncultured Roseburia sp.]